jgi:flagellar hook capping protein FlgD
MDLGSNFYQIMAKRNKDANSLMRDIKRKTRRSIPTSVRDPDIDSERDLSLSSYPNPFMTSTTIQYLLPVAGRVDLSIYDISGRRVRTLVGENKPEGMHTVDWNGFDDSGHSVDAGMYFCMLIVGAHSIVEGHLLLR